MIRKIVLCAFAIAATSFAAQAQCTPDTTLKSTGYTPDSLPHAQVNVAYSLSLSVRPPGDTMVDFNGSQVNAKVDSVKATDVKGLPAGFGYQCQHPRCVFISDTTRCVHIFGTTSQAGVYPIKIMVTYYALLAGSFKVAYKDSIQKFTLVVDGNANSVLDNTRPGAIAYPNPSSGKVYFSDASARFSEDILITDLNGKKLLVNIYRENSLWVADMKGIASGVYLVRSAAGVQRIEVLSE